MPEIVLESVSRVHPDGTRALYRLDLTVPDGELLTVVGPSGCGKTTLLRLLAGLEKPTEGRITFDGADIAGLEPRQRDVAMVFQEGALYAHLTAKGNIAFPLRMRGVAREDTVRRVGREARRLGILRLLPRKPKELSTGHRHAVATGRALVREPSLFLLDEPLANLDVALRARGREEIRQLHQEMRRTTIYATNDQAEAMILGDRVAVLNRGELQQAGAPLELYRRPVNLFVARFVGSPPMNIVAATPERDAQGGWWLTVGRDRLQLNDAGADALRVVAAWLGRRLLLGLRPEHLTLSHGDPFARCLHATCRRVEFLGGELLVHCALEGDGEQRLVARVPAGAPPSPGNRVELAADLEHLHLFDPETGRALV